MYYYTEYNSGIILLKIICNSASTSERATQTKEEKTPPALAAQAGACASFGALMLSTSGALSVISSDTVGMMVKNILRSVESTEKKTALLSSVIGAGFAVDYFIPRANLSLGDMSTGVAIKTLNREWDQFLEGDPEQNIERSILWIGGSSCILGVGAFTVARLGTNPILMDGVTEALSTASKHLHKRLPKTTKGLYAGILLSSIVYDLKFSSKTVLISAMPLSLILKEAMRSIEAWQQGYSEDENGKKTKLNAAPQSQQILALTAAAGTNVSLLTLFNAYSPTPALAVLAAGTNKISTRLIRNMFRQFRSEKLTLCVAFSLFASASLFYLLKKDPSSIESVAMIFFTTTAIALSQDMIKNWQLGKPYQNT